MMSAMSPQTGPGSPPAARPRTAGWRDPRVVVGVIVVALSVLAGSLLFSGADDSVSVWAVREPMRQGQPIGTEDLVRTETRFADAASADRYVAASDVLPEDAVLTRDVGAGELLPRDALGASDSAALTELPLAVATEAVPATLAVGAVVDVWVAAEPGAAAPKLIRRRASLVLDDVAVVALPRESSALGPAATRQVIVALTEDQAAELPDSIAALQAGAVVLTRER